jgi:PAS domain S-box-containing protein
MTRKIRPRQTRPAKERPRTGAATRSARKESEEALRRAEDSYRTLVELSPDAMLVHDEGTVLFANPAYAALLGASSLADVLGKPVLGFIHPEDREAVRQRMRDHFHGPSLIRAETRLIRFDGQVAYVEVIARSFNYRGKPAAQVVFRDIAARKTVEDALRKSEANLADAQRIAHIGSFEQDLSDLSDLEKNPLHWSDEAFRIFGYEPGNREISRTKFLNAVHPGDRERIHAAVMQAIRDRSSCCLDYRIVRPDGSERIIHSRSNVVCDESSGRPLRLVGTMHDVTERMRAEERIRLLAQAVEHSHELIAMGDLEGRVTFANRAFLRTLGYSEEEFLGMHWTRILSPRNRPDLLEEIWRAVLGTGEWKGECVQQRKDGTHYSVYLSVGSLVDGAGSIVGTMGIAQDISERKKAEEKFYKAFNLSPEPISITTMLEGRFLDVNESFLRATGYAREELIGRTSLEAKFWTASEDRARFVHELPENGPLRDREIVFHTKTGERRTALNSAEVIEIAGQKCIIAVLKDITERALLEKRLHQAQKMEAVGRLSGGIAHDFNNLLTVIKGNSDVLANLVDQNGLYRQSVEQISRAADRAASLTRQLLAFSRMQVLQPDVLDLNAVVAEMTKMLSRLIGEHIEFVFVPDKSLGRIKADPGQIEQVIVNLAVNARDAMPRGGKLVIESRNVFLDRAYVRGHQPVVAGEYVMLAVSDTGHGMDAETQSRIFEPFFTTKEPGKGTGLGLSTVYGIVKQSGGFIWAYSEQGLGTAMKIYFPRIYDAVEPARAVKADLPPLGGTETVLLAEDEEDVRLLMSEYLQQNGYAVLPARNGEDAIEIAERHDGPIHLLVTDVVMPKIGGWELAERLANLRPDLKVIYLSGYTEYSTAPCDDRVWRDAFIQKPFAMELLARKIREVLGTPASLGTRAEN